METGDVRIRNSLMRKGADVAFEFVLPRKSVDQQIGSCVVDLINWREIDQEEHTDHYTCSTHRHTDRISG